MKINYRSMAAGVVLLFILVGGILLVQKIRPRPVLKPGVPALLPGVVAYTAKPKIKGAETAPVKLVEYSDFECPSCRMATEILDEFFKKYPEKIQLQYKHFPLQSHPWSLSAHQAAECMNAQGKFWAYHDMLYKNQREWGPSKTPPAELLLKYAREAGADMNQLSSCLSDVAVTRAIFVEKDEGNSQQVGATPTFFLGEKRFVGAKGLKEEGENAIREVLGLPPITIDQEAQPEKTSTLPSDSTQKEKS